MKRIIYFVLAILVCGIYVGCSENEIDLYDQTPRINFYGSTTHVRTLVDTDYVKKEPYAVDSFEVRIQGDFLKENRDFCVKVTPNNDYQNSVDVLLESKYTYTDLDTVCQIFYYKINRPKVQAGRNVYGCYLEFDLNNPLHQFDKGLVEKNQIVLNVRWELKPTQQNGCPEYCQQIGSIELADKLNCQLVVVEVEQHSFKMRLQYPSFKVTKASQ